MSNGTPPIQPAPSPPSAPGVVQPEFASGSPTAPATPIPITGTPIIPTSTPPGGVGQIGDPIGFPVFPPTGSNTAPVAVPPGPLVGPAVTNAAVPPSVAGIAQPVFKTGNATTPTAASLFPEFTATSPSPPIVFANIAMIGTGKPPSTATTAAIVISTAPAIPQLPWNPGPSGLPLNTTAPAITYTPPAHPGTVLTCSTGVWTNSPTSYGYQWLRDGEPIAGATHSTYTLVNADRGNPVTCIVTAINSAGESSIEAAVVPVPASADVNLDPDLDPDLPSRAAKPAHHRAPTKPTKRR